MQKNMLFSMHHSKFQNLLDPAHTSTCTNLCIFQWFVSHSVPASLVQQPPLTMCAAGILYVQLACETDLPVLKG